MSSPIYLPPLPNYARLAAALGPIGANQLCVTKWKDGINIEVPCGDVDQMFRARDLEIARVVLEAAAKMCHEISATRYGEYKGRKPNPNGLRAYDPYLDGLADGAGECEDAISALEFRHE